MITNVALWRLMERLVWLGRGSVLEWSMSMDTLVANVSPQGATKNIVASILQDLFSSFMPLSRVTCPNLQ